MSRYADNVIDRATGRPIENVTVSIYTTSGALATLTNDASLPLLNPVTTDQDGAFSFNAADGIYSAIFVRAGRVLYVDEQIVVGSGALLPTEVVAAIALLNNDASFTQSGAATVVTTASAKLANAPLDLTDFAGGTAQLRLTRAITEGQQVRNSALGGAIRIPRALQSLTAQFNIGNRVSIEGVNKRGSILQAAAGFVGTSMMTVVNGATSTFDNRLSNLTLDCNDVAGLSGIISSAWQEGGGMRDVLLQKFRVVGLNIVDTIGGVSQVLIENSEFFGSALGAVNCIRFNDPSPVSSCILMMSNLAVTGGVPVASPGGLAEQAAARAGMPVAVNIVNGSSTSIGVHVEVAERGFLIDGNGRHTIIGSKGAAPNGMANAGVETLVEIAATFTGTLIMIGCSRNGATNFVKDLRVGGVGTISVDQPYFAIYSEPPISPGSIYAYGTFDGTTVGSPSAALCRGVLSISRVSAGNWIVTTTRSLANVDQTIPLGICANINGVEPFRVSKLGVNTFRIELRTLAGTSIDSNEVKFAVMRL